MCGYGGEGGESQYCKKKRIKNPDVRLLHIVLTLPLQQEGWGEGQRQEVEEVGGG